MGKWKCSVCGYIHDEQNDGLFSDLPEEWVCPWCKAPQSVFVLEGGELKQEEVDVSLLSEVKEGFSNLELSAICSNLAKGCQKQYLEQEANLFTTLSEEFKSKAVSPEVSSMELLLQLVEKDLNELAPLVESIASTNKDRGALRAHAWNTKVTMILKSLISQYLELGEQMINNTNVYVCTICGFIYLGNELPDICPICKVPNYKFEEIGGQ